MEFVAFNFSFFCPDNENTQVSNLQDFLAYLDENVYTCPISSTNPWPIFISVALSI